VGKQLALIPGAPDLDVDRTRTVLLVKIRLPPREPPTIGFLPIVEDEFSPVIRSKRVKVSVPRMLRDGDRPQSLGSARMTRKERQFAHWEEWALEAEGVTFGPPATFGDCPTSGPCVRVSCRHHNYLEVDEEKGTVKLNFPHLEPQDLKHPCSIRVAIKAAARVKDRGPRGEVMSHAEVSAKLGLTSERTRQLEAGALRRVKRDRSDLR
jgi:hypothetical protein